MFKLRLRHWGWGLVLLGAGLCAWDRAAAESFVLPPADLAVVGQLQSTRADRAETLLDIARRFDVGQEEILLVNPDVDRWLPKPGAEVLLPTSYILPDAPRRGLVLNLPEMRLYYYGERDEQGRPLVITHPVSIGRMDWNTPLGQTRVARKTENPVWRPPLSIREEALADGRELPEVVPAGPDNPLGGYALYLGVPGYLIHSTNKPYGVGMRVTHGCIRMYPEDIEGLYPRVPVGTPVYIVNQPIKLGWHAETLFVEVHPRLDEDEQQGPPLLRELLERIYAFAPEFPVQVDGAALKAAVVWPQGIPLPISRPGIAAEKVLP
jgi:L,D-transpeptidase ErfK/SrfK